MKEYKDKAYDTRDEQGNIKVAAKNIKTNNMKKGFGNSTVGHLFSSYKYQGTPFDNQKDHEKNEKMTHKAKILTPFSGSNPNTTFTPHYQTYQNLNDPYLAKPEDQYRDKSNNKWTYNNANKKGFYGTFSEFPKHVEEGEKEKQQLRH